MKISEHFTLEELTFSPTAINKGFKEQNTPPLQVIENLKVASLNILEPIRLKFGAFVTSSAYRCERLNKAVGGSKTSYHAFGMAFDINFNSKNKELFKFIYENLEFSELIWEYGNDNLPSWVHVAYDEDNLSKTVKRFYDKKTCKILTKDDIKKLIL